MDHRGDHHVETTGKVLTFPPPYAEAEASAADVVRSNEAHVMRRRRRQAEWFEGAWVLLAWVLAAIRLAFAVRQRQVFGLEASTSFLLFVSAPLFLARRIAAVVRGAVHALGSAIRARRGVERAKAAEPARLPAGRRGRVGKRGRGRL